MRRIVTIVRLLALALLVGSSAYFLGMKYRWYRPNPTFLGLAVTACSAWLAVELIASVVQRARRRIDWLAFAGRASLQLGLLGIFGGGLANWAYSLQGMVILAEGDVAPFFHGSHLQEFHEGPLSNVREMDLVLHLDKVELRPTPNGSYTAVSMCRIERPGEPVHRFELGTQQSASDGTLRFIQGVFGFAPRIVILDKGEQLFDQHVPFMTRADDSGKVVFVGEFTVERYGLHVTGSIALDTLDPKWRGHPRLDLQVSRDGVPLGAGSLMPGRFADIANGHRIGFAGLKKWAEIDLMRKNYPQPMQWGAVLAAIGLFLVVGGWLTRRAEVA